MGFLRGATKAAKGGSKGWLAAAIREYEQQLKAEEEAKRQARQSQMDQSLMSYRNQRLQLDQDKLNQPKEKTAGELLDEEKLKNYMSLSPEERKKADFPKLFETEKPVKTETSQEERQTDRLMDLYGQREAVPGYGGMLPGPPDLSLIVPFEREIPMLESVLGIGNKPPKEVEPGKLEERAKAGIGLAKEFISAGFAVPEAIAKADSLMDRMAPEEAAGGADEGDIEDELIRAISQYPEGSVVDWEGLQAEYPDVDIEWIKDATGYK